MKSISFVCTYLLAVKKTTKSVNTLSLYNTNYLVKDTHRYMSMLFISNYVIVLGVALLIVLSFNDVLTSLLFSTLFAVFLGFVIPVSLTLASGIEKM